MQNIAFESIDFNKDEIEKTIKKLEDTKLKEIERTATDRFPPEAINALKEFCAETLKVSAIATIFPDKGNSLLLVVREFFTPVKAFTFENPFPIKESFRVEIVKRGEGVISALLYFSEGIVPYKDLKSYF